jgi:CheY-like chemotaxis protein
MNVLLIDDDADIRAVGTYCLRHMGGLEVACASSALEGLALAQSLQPDIILLDVMMPGIDGITTLQRLQAHAATASIPVVFMTAKVQRHEVDGYLALGAKAVIQKPFDPVRLPAQVREQMRTP